MLLVSCWTVYKGVVGDQLVLLGLIGAFSKRPGHGSGGCGGEKSSQGDKGTGAGPVTGRLKDSPLDFHGNKTQLALKAPPQC